MHADPAELARYVRQRTELGAREWILDGMTTSEALKLAREAGAPPEGLARRPARPGRPRNTGAQAELEGEA